MRQVALTTVDNPHNPFEDFDAWDSYDRRQGYNTASFLGRIAMTSDDLSEQEYLNAVELAIDEIVQMNTLGLYKKITRD